MTPLIIIPFREDVPPIDLTAVVEGTIAAVFQHLKYQIIYEIDEPEFRSNWRELVVAARKEVEGKDIPESNCNVGDEIEHQNQNPE